MNVYTITGFTGHYPVGTAAVIVARDEASARELLDAQLTARGLAPHNPALPLQRLPLHTAFALILADGNY